MTDIRAQLTAAVESTVRNDLHAPTPLPAGVIASHVIDVLLSLPIAIVELPEADANCEFEGGRVWINPLTGFVRFLAAQFQPKEARSVAAALLAAAVAEREAK